MLFPSTEMKGKKMTVKRLRLSRVQLIALGFLVMILLGALLLMLPIATNSGEVTPFSDTLFTSVSASCVTGLVVKDTATYWSLFGQIVILLLIQTGGLGFITIAIMFLLIMRKRIGLSTRELLVESLNMPQSGGVVRLAKRVLGITSFFELGGALILSTVFIPKFGFAKGAWFSLFHAVSSFCNAGFDLMGGEGEFSSMMSLGDNPVVLITLMVLILAGGTGFIVTNDLITNRFRLRRCSLMTKLVLSSGAILVFGGALLFFIFEYSNEAAGATLGEKILTAFFNSVTSRTAGFNNMDIAKLSEAGKLTMISLMYIGGNSGSTAGGVKVTSVAVVLLSLIAGMKNERSAHIFGRRISEDTLKKAVQVMTVNMLLALAGCAILTATSGVSLTDAMFESMSAIGTVGITTGITRSVTAVSRIALIFLMYCGRVGSISFALAMLEGKIKSEISYPTENLTVG